MIAQSLFGRTGHSSSRTLFGAAALGHVSQEDAERSLDLLLEYGVNHIDTANSYGEAEQRIGPWLESRRADFFLATKTEDRSYAGAKEHLQRSLDLMRTDHIDLWQLHCLVDEGEWQQAMGPGGALEAFVEAREQGLVRFLGVTGHGTVTPAMHLRSLERFDFDSVLLPYNYMMMQNPQYAANFERLAAVCAERNVALQTIKSICRRPWNGRVETATVWYEPLEEQADIDQAVGYVFQRPQLFLNTAGDIRLLPKVLDAANRYAAGPDESAMQALAAALEMEPMFV
jgi:aryl-alcohol dehydrogenase-like predicted oxidoreductase